MREFIRIVPNPILRDPRTEQRILEYNRDRFLYQLMLAGSVLMLVAIVW